MRKLMIHRRVFYIGLKKFSNEITTVIVQDYLLDSDPIAVKVVENKPYVSFHNGQPSGVDIDLLLILAKKLIVQLILRVKYVENLTVFHGISQRTMNRLFTWIVL